MNRSTRSVIIVGAGIALAVASFFALPVIKQKSGATPTSEQATPSTAWVYGNGSARYTIVEYADLECPYCKEYFPQLKSWIDQHPDVNLQWHHLPLPMHEPRASFEARWAECAGKEGGNAVFWQAIELIYKNTRSAGAGTANAPQLPGFEDRQAKLNDCAATNSSVLQKVRSQIDQASLDGITATPTLIVKDRVSGRSIKLQGAPDGDVLLSAIDWLSNKETPSDAK